MKKFLAATTAVVAGIGLAVPASAEITISGSLSQDIGFGTYNGACSAAIGEIFDDTDFDAGIASPCESAETEASIHSQSDAEVHVKGSGTTDGGLVVEVVIELEGTSGQSAGANGGESVDESRISISGDFGKITLGSEDAASVTHGYVGIGGGYAGMGYYDGGGNYTPVGSPFPAGYDDSQGIRYSLPPIAGLSAAISYQPDTDAYANTGKGNANGQIGLGASFSQDLGNMSFTIGGGYLKAGPNEGEEDPAPNVGAGVSVGFGDATANLRYDKKGDIASLGFGVDYSIGALKMGIGYSSNGRAEAEQNVLDNSDNSVVENASALVEYADSTLISAGVSYSLGGGVSASAGVSSGTSNEITVTRNNDDDTTNTTTIAAVDGVGIGMRIGLSF